MTYFVYWTKIAIVISACGRFNSCILIPQKSRFFLEKYAVTFLDFGDPREKQIRKYW